MTEPAHHDADDGFHEIQLSGKQLVFLFMAGTTVAVMIFLCGVWVGRGVPADRGVGGDNPDPMAAATPAPTSAQPVGSSGPPSAEPPAPARDDELSYAKRLQAESVQTEKLKSPSQTPTPKAGPPVPPPAPKEQPSTSSAKPAPPQAKTEPAAPQMTARAGTWVVQVVSLQDRSSATAIARRLSAKGYPAFVLDPAAGGPRIFRVQVGGYTDKNEAEQASRRLERDEQFKPFVRAR